jgi:ribosomal-protein-alanine N-acetyltransferase
VIEKDTVKVREAYLWDWPAIEILVRRARHTSPSLWEWKAFRTDVGCVLIEEKNLVRGVLFASSDESPVAWVRLAAVEDDLSIGRWLDLSLPKLLMDLQALAARELAWLDCGEWARSYLATRGFRQLTQIITLAKTIRDTPELTAAGVTIRPARKADFGAVVSVDRAAFSPYWWRSEATVRRRAATASRFTVAEYHGRVVGYTEWESHLPDGHLKRIAVAPDDQGRGIGALLLNDVLRTLWQHGIEEISLNTQVHNHRARRLYECFGFRPTGDPVTVWRLHL